MEKREVLSTAGLIAGSSIATLAKTAILDHRIMTHESLSADDIEPFMRVAGSYLTDTKRWAGVHLIHHATPDANLNPFVELSDFLDWQEANNNRSISSDDTPNKVYGMDPVIQEMDIETAREIGEKAKENEVGDKHIYDFYQPKKEYSVEDAQKILYGTEARYFYEPQSDIKSKNAQPIKFDPDNLPSLHDIRFLLRDPHSPALHKMGVPGVLIYNVPLYGYVERNFVNAEFLPKNLKPDDTDKMLREHRKVLRNAYVGAMILANIGINRPKNLKEFSRVATIGAAASGLAVAALAAGGNITNAFGHAGNLGSSNISDFMNGVVYPKSDGTFSTNNGLLSAPTLDEVGGQEVHHDYPYKIAYSNNIGLKRFADAPFGTVLELLVKKEILLKVGKNFSDSGHRLDEPSEAVLQIQNERKKILS